jgi:hypothetical protein
LGQKILGLFHEMWLSQSLEQGVCLMKYFGSYNGVPANGATRFKMGIAPAEILMMDHQ